MSPRKQNEIRRIAHALETYERNVIPLDRWRESAVLIPVFFKDDELQVLLTKRSNDVEHHKGEVSFPGGARDPEDEDLIATALRETWEEVGVPVEDVQVLGAVDDHLTYTGFRITPYAGLIPYPYPFNPSDNEIDHVIEIPIREVMENERFEVHKTGFVLDDKYTYSFPYNGDVVWGATARILVHFLSIVYGFDAPVPPPGE